MSLSWTLSVTVAAAVGVFIGFLFGATVTAASYDN